MVTYMKTTIDLPDELVRDVKELARTRGVTMRELMVEGLRNEIERRQQDGPQADFVFATAPVGKGLRPGIQAGDAIRVSYDLPA